MIKSIFIEIQSLLQETQEVVDLCFKHGIYPDCKIVEAKDIDWTWDQLMKINSDGIRYGNSYIMQDSIIKEIYFIASFQ